MELSYPKYIHKPLDDIGDQIRLMKLLPHLDEAGQIQCELEQFNLSEAPPYYALSYEWGSSESLRSVSVEGASLSIRRNLWLFLDMFRRRTDENVSCYLWIDQLCIDQAHTLERNHQVKLMGDIYSKAVTVKVWLGPSDGVRMTILEAMLKREYCCSIPDPYDGPEIVQNILVSNEAKVIRMLNKSACDACAYVLDPPWTSSDREQQRSRKSIGQLSYWSRLWIVQENVLAKDVIFYLGAVRCSRAVMRRFINRYYYITSEEDQDFLKSLLCPHGISSGLSLFELMMNFGSNQLQCSNPRDLVFGLMGMVNAADQILIDYDLPTSKLHGFVLERLVMSPDHQMAEDRSRYEYAPLLADRLGVPCCWQVWLDLPSSMKEYHNLIRRIFALLDKLVKHGFGRGKWSFHEIMAISLVATDSDGIRVVKGPLWPLYDIDHNCIARLNSVNVADLPGLLEQLSGSANYLTEHHEPIAWVDMIKPDWHPQIRDEVCQCTWSNNDIGVRSDCVNEARLADCPETNSDSSFHNSGFFGKAHAKIRRISKLRFKVYGRN